MDDPPVKKRDWLWAGSIVALVQVGCTLLLWLLPERIDLLHNLLMFPVVFPGPMVVALFHLRNLHDIARWEIAPAVLISWLFYTWLLRLMFVLVRRLRAQRGTPK